MKIKLPTFKRNPEKARALAIARQSAAFYDIAAKKGGNSVSGRTTTAYKRRNKVKGKHHGATPPRTEPRQHKAKYFPGKLGASDVSIKIKEKYGSVITRQHRKRLHKGTAGTATPRPIFYNGPVYFRKKGGKAQ